MPGYKTRLLGTAAFALAASTMTLPDFAQAQDAAAKPNILVIMGDDIGWFNTSVYNSGMMGYRTPHIDSIAAEGIRFTDAYGQQSCTAGRAAFITGQTPKRTGLLQIGLPGDPVGLSGSDPTIAELLKPLGYATGQFGKNHLGDLDEFLPTNHGFDEFFGNLYHLNAEEEPENPDYPTDPAFRERFGPRGVIQSYADGRIEDTGPLTKKRMETIDREVLDKTVDFIQRQEASDTPWFTWFNTTRMHVFTHLSEDSDGKTGLGIFADGMVEHDTMVGELLDRLEELGADENTIIIYTTDNGAEKFTWPDGATTPFRGEKATTWEGGLRIPFMMKWPGNIPEGQISNEILSLEDMLPTLLAAAGESGIKEKLLEGYQVGEQEFRVHLDGYNLLPHLTGVPNAGDWPRREFFGFTDDGTLATARFGRFKFHFTTQEHEGVGSWFHTQEQRKAPLLIDLLADPFETAPVSSSYYDDWLVRHMFTFIPAQQQVMKFVNTFNEFPPRLQGEANAAEGG